jgi:hypothetical protein
MTPASLTTTAFAKTLSEANMSEVTLTKPEDIQPNADSFKLWMGEAEMAIKNVISNAADQLEEIGVAMTKVRRLWAELKNEI